MILYPAIDIRGGRCVRLIEGDFDRETAYDSDPSSAARRWVEAGADWLHVVDLDGAVDGDRSIGESCCPDPRLGRRPDPARWRAPPVDRSRRGVRRRRRPRDSWHLALRDPELVSSAVARWGDRIAVALDARDGRLATDGWLGRPMPAPSRWHSDWLRDVCDILSTPTFDVTARSPGRTWTLSTSLSRRSTRTSLPPAALASLDDIKAVEAAGATGAIVGRALYDGRIDLGKASR